VEGPGLIPGAVEGGEVTAAPAVLLTRPLPDQVIEYLKARCELRLKEEDRPIPREVLLAEASGAHGLLTMLTDRIDDEVLDAAGPQLRVVSNYAVGYDNVDVAACSRRGILVTNTPDVLTDATADLAWSLILSASRRVAEGDRLVRDKTPWGWAPGFMLGREVTGKVLGIVGFGRIGQAVAARAAGFSMPIVYASRWARRDVPGRFRTFHELLAEADIISVHVPLNDETRHLFGQKAFETMKPTAVLVNTSRGPVVDEAALADALRSGQIFAAGLDVYENEPEVHPSLLELDNVVLAPHLGSATVETRLAMGMLAAENLVAALEGREPRALVNRELLSE
jgi:glyoxylate reductase